MQFSYSDFSLKRLRHSEAPICSAWFVFAGCIDLMMGMSSGNRYRETEAIYCRHLALFSKKAELIGKTLNM